MAPSPASTAPGTSTWARPSARTGRRGAASPTAPPATPAASSGLSADRYGPAATAGRRQLAPSVNGAVGVWPVLGPQHLLVGLPDAGEREGVDHVDLLGRVHRALAAADQLA